MLKVKYGDFEFFNLYRSGKPITLGNDILRVEVEAIQC